MISVILFRWMLAKNQRVSFCHGRRELEYKCFECCQCCIEELKKFRPGCPSVTKKRANLIISNSIKKVVAATLPSLQAGHSTRPTPFSPYPMKRDRKRGKLRAQTRCPLVWHSHPVLWSAKALILYETSIPDYTVLEQLLPVCQQKSHLSLFPRH